MVFVVVIAATAAAPRVVDEAERAAAARIDRRALVTRHNIEWDDARGEIPLGNGEFVFNADGTGLQTLGGATFSHRAWHSKPRADGCGGSGAGGAGPEGASRPANTPRRRGHGGGGGARAGGPRADFDADPSVSSRIGTSDTRFRPGFRVFPLLHGPVILP